jgi:signal transduction histidine kinase/ligand-binding sensor domain-containing protein
MKRQLPFSFFFITGFLCFGFLSFAQDIHFKLVTRWQDDLGGAVLGMTQDTQGFLWFSTENGLYKYDGYKYSTYHNEPLNPNSPAADNIWVVAADQAGNIWSAPSRSGLDRLDPATGIFTHFRHSNNDPTSLASDTVFAIMQDHEGTIWIGTNAGLDRFDNKTNTFFHYSNKANDPLTISCNVVTTIYEDKQGTIWVGTGTTFTEYDSCGGLNKLDKKTGKFTRYVHDNKDKHSLIDNRVRAIFEDSRGNFWVGTAGDGLHTMDRTKGIFERHLYDPSHPDKLSRPPRKKLFSFADDYISFITEDDKRRIWIGTFGGGINVYDPSMQKVTYFGADINIREKQANNGFCMAYKTRDDVIWISAYGNNFYKILPYQNILPHTRIGKVVLSSAEDNAYNLWLGTDKGLIRKDSSGKEEHFLIDKDSSSLSNIISYIEKDGNKFWIGTLAGLYLFDPVTKAIVRFYHKPGKANSLMSDTVIIVKKGTGNMLWIGSFEGLDLMDTKSGMFRHFPNKSDTSSIDFNGYGTIYIDKKQNVWVGTFNGLKRLNVQSGLFRTYLNQLITHSILEDREGNLWAGTSAGLFKYDKGTDNFLRFTDESAIMTKAVFAGAVTEDHEQNLWLLTPKGIVRLNKERSSAVLYGKNQGVNSLAFTYFGYTRQNGEILYADTSGYFNFRPDLLQQDVSPPFVTVSNFSLNNEPVLPAARGILSGPLAQTKEIRLSHDQNTFSFEFTNIDFVSAHEDTRLLYLLQNYDNAWRKAGDERTAYYFNVPPGKYIFKVKAFNSAGRAAQKNIAIIITPPWWNTWWAYSLCALIAGSIFYVLYRSRINQLKRKQAVQINVMVAAQEGERKRISRDLHDEVGTKLSALKLFLSSLHEKAIDTTNEEIKSLAESSEQFVTEAMQDVRRLLLNLSPAVLEEFGYSTAVEGLINKINETKQIHFNLVMFGMNQRVKKEYELALYRITQELINNVLKHAEAKHVSLQIGQRDEKIILMMEDDGKGFDVNAHKDGYGLKNLDARTKLMQGVMTIDSHPDKGTSVLIEIPYNFNEA